MSAAPDRRERPMRSAFAAHAALTAGARNRRRPSPAARRARSWPALRTAGFVLILLAMALTADATLAHACRGASVPAWCMD